MSARFALLLLAPAALLAPAGLLGCKAVGSEGGPCTAGGACDPGLSCLSDLCVQGGDEGEGEGEPGCAGDGAASADLADCNGIAAAACGDDAAVTACTDAALVLRSGLFQAAFDCLADLGATDCGDAPVNACFAELTACDHPAGDALCGLADDACREFNDTGFPLSTCETDLASVNQDFLDLYRSCFDGNPNLACSEVHDACYNDAFARLVDPP